MNPEDIDDVLEMTRRAKDDAELVRKHPDSTKTGRLAEAVVALATVVERLIESARPPQ